MNIKNISRKFCVAVLFVLLLTMVQCAEKNSAESAGLPKDVLGIKLGMNKADAEQRLREIAEFSTDADKRQQLWIVKDKQNFSSVAIGYNTEGKIRFVTAFAEKGKVQEPLRFKDVGDLSRATEEITEPHHRYTWKLEAAEDYPAYMVTVYGADPEFLSSYSISDLEGKKKKKK